MLFFLQAQDRTEGRHGAQALCLHVTMTCKPAKTSSVSDGLNGVSATSFQWLVAPVLKAQGNLTADPEMPILQLLYCEVFQHSTELYVSKHSWAMTNWELCVPTSLRSSCCLCNSVHGRSWCTGAKVQLLLGLWQGLFWRPSWGASLWAA